MLIELLQLFFICLSFFTLLIIIIIQFYRIVRKKIIFELFIIEYIKFYFLVINIIFIFLIYSYLISDFSIINIIENSHENIPILYKLSGLWSNHEGSIFLWLWVLSLYSFFLSLFSSKIKPEKLSNILFFQLHINLFFSFFIIFTSNPIIRINFFSLTGTELNPILQDPGLIIHPPFLYLGYLGSTITFCYSLFLLKNQSFFNIDFILIKSFVLISWLFLSTGIFLGSWWAYHELGWGGWWFWDPVENISLLPWLTLTASLHFLIILEKNKLILFKSLVLLLFTYILSIMGTFFVRSGLLASVHSFATDIFRATFILFFIIILIIVSIYFSKQYLNSSFIYNYNTKPVSKYNFINYNIIILILTTLIILIGTYSPTLFTYFLERQVSIGPTYYNQILFPLIPFFIIIMTISPFLNWYKGSLKVFLFKNTFNLGFILIITILFSLILNLFNFIISIIVIFSILSLISLFFIIKKINSMIIAHIAINIFILSVILSSFFEETLTLLIKPGQDIFFKDYHIILRSLNQLLGPNFNSTYGEILVLDKNFDYLSIFFPEKRLYFINNIFTSKAVIKSNFFTDFYIMLGDGNINNGWYTKIIYKPGMVSLWFSFILLIISGLKSLYELKLNVKKKIIWI